MIELEKIDITFYETGPPKFMNLPMTPQQKKRFDYFIWKLLNKVAQLNMTSPSKIKMKVRHEEKGIIIEFSNGMFPIGNHTAEYETVYKPIRDWLDKKCNLHIYNMWGYGLVDGHQTGGYQMDGRHI